MFFIRTFFNVCVSGLHAAHTATLFKQDPCAVCLVVTVTCQKHEKQVITYKCVINYLHSPQVQMEARTDTKQGHTHPHRYTWVGNKLLQLWADVCVVCVFVCERVCCRVGRWGSLDSEVWHVSWLCKIRLQQFHVDFLPHSPSPLCQDGFWLFVWVTLS